MVCCMTIPTTHLDLSITLGSYLRYKLIFYCNSDYLLRFMPWLLFSSCFSCSTCWCRCAESMLNCPLRQSLGSRLHQVMISYSISALALYMGCRSLAELRFSLLTFIHQYTQLLVFHVIKLSVLYSKLSSHIHILAEQPQRMHSVAVAIFSSTSASKAHQVVALPFQRWNNIFRQFICVITWFIHTHSYIFPFIHSYFQTYQFHLTYTYKFIINTLINSGVYSLTHSPIHLHSYIFIHSFIYLNIHTFKRSHIYSYSCIYYSILSSYIHAWIHSFIHLHVYSYTNVFIHICTYIHSHIHTFSILEFWSICCSLSNLKSFC